MKTLIALALLLLPCGLRAAATDDPDRLFSRGEYEQALQGYEAAAAAGGEAGLKALYRAAECQGLLFRYAEAAQRLKDMKLPQDPLWRARFLLLRAETARQYQLQYGYSQSRDEEQGTEDVTKFTTAQWRRRISADYDALWPLRGELLKQRLESEDYFFDLKDAELSYTPTLWDFAVERWTSWLLDEARDGAAAPRAEPFAEPGYKADYAVGAPAAQKAAAVFEDAAGISSAAMDFAREYWRLRRLLIPFEHSGLVAAHDAARLRARAEETLLGWAASFKAPPARAWAWYHAAEFARQKGEPAAAVERCGKAGEESPRSRPAKLCERLRAQIELPQLELAASFAPPPGRKSLSVSAANIEKVWFRAYRTTPTELASIGRYGREGWSRARYLEQDAVRHFLRGGRGLEWSQQISYDKPYSRKTEEVRSPDLAKGVYVVVASADGGFEDGSSLMKAVLLNITDVFLLGTPGLAGDPERQLHDQAVPDRKIRAEAFRLYAVDALSGKALPSASIDAHYYSNDSSGWRRAELRTGPDGAALFETDFTVRYPSHRYLSLDPLLTHKGAYAYWGGPASTSFSVPAPVSLHAETDRPVYRPGQEVKFKVTALYRVPGGYRAYDGKGEITVVARDANWQDVATLRLKVSGLGSAAGSFKIPEGRLLGDYSLTASMTEYGYNFTGSARFGVEEYKRPEFEVKLAAPEGAFRYGQKAEVSGEARYYFGAPVPGAAVKYRVTRSRYVPWFCWYWSWFYSYTPPVEVASGETKAGDDGKFRFSFTPVPESDKLAPYPSSYQVEVEARDAGGRTITDSRAYRAGSRAWLFDVKPDAGFFTPEAPATLTARLMDLNDAQRGGRAGYELYRLEGEPAAPEAQPYWGSFGRSPSLERAFDAVPDGARAAKGELEFSPGKPSSLDLGRLQPGAYRLRLKARDPWGGEAESRLILVSASPAGANPGLKLPAVALFERDSYRPGETARVLAGASALKGNKFVEVLAGGGVLARATLPGGLSVYPVKVTNVHRGGFGLRWLGAGGFKIYSAMEDADVPRTDKLVSLDLEYGKVLAPGEKVSWRLRARDAAGKPVSGEALVKVFDRSLEYYGKDAGFWGDALYPRRASYSGGAGSLFTPGAVQLPVRTGVVKRMLEAFRTAVAEERLASLRVNSTRVHGGRHNYFSKSLGFEEGMPAMAASRSSMASEMADAEAPGGMALSAKSEKKAKEDVSGGKALAPGAPAPQEAPAPEVKVRTDFSETAYYNPQLKVLNGEAEFGFRIPERLTSWKISGYVLTRGARRGSVAAEAVTKKDLMVRLDLPRFFREGDSSRLTALVTNDTAGELSGAVQLSVSKDGAEAHGDFGLEGLSKPFTVKAAGTVPLYWEIKAPRGTGAYKVRAVARSGRLADAQENDLPVLPSRERLIASGVAALDGDASKTFSLPELEAKDPTREVESLHLEVQPQLLLTVLNSLPFLVHYPHECTEQLLNRYVPLAITNSFYSKYPALRSAVGKVPKRSTLTPEWERDNPVRLMSLMETPWERESRGRRSYWPAVDLLDPKVVAGEREEALGKLKSYQNQDGSFPWFPGGRPSLYMTLYALNGLAEAANYGVEIPRDMAQRALAWTLSEVPSHMKAEPGEVATVLYAAYVVTSFPADWPESSQAREMAKAWVDYADKHSNAMTAFGKAYAAYVYHRLGEAQKAQDYLARAMDGARTDEISGTYWAPEKISWLWYNDTVEKHAFILRTLLALRPKDPKVPGLVRWLLFNRKANEWKSTKASAAAIFSLLDVMKAKGAMDKGETISVKWGKVSDSVALQPFDWAAKPLRWSQYGAEARKAPLAPKVEKKGPGLAFASFTGIYTTDKTAAESPDGMMNVSRKYFLRLKAGDAYSLKPLSDGDAVSVGDQVEVHLTVRTRSQFEYVHLKDPKAAGFEAEELNSGWKWDQLGRYEEPRDSLTNFFMEWLPHGEYVLKYRLRPTTPGVFKAGAAVLQSMYAPEFAAHSSGFTLVVK